MEELRAMGTGRAKSSRTSTSAVQAQVGASPTAQSSSTNGRRRTLPPIPPPPPEPPLPEAQNQAQALLTGLPTILAAYPVQTQFLILLHMLHSKQDEVDGLRRELEEQTEKIKQVERDVMKSFNRMNG